MTHEKRPSPRSRVGGSEPLSFLPRCREFSRSRARETTCARSANVSLRSARQIRYKSPMIIRACLASDATGIESLFREFVAYLRSIGDENDYRFGAQQYLTDGFGNDPSFRGFVAEDASGLIGYVLFSRSYDGDYVRNLYVVDLYVQQASRGKGVGRALMNAVRNIGLAEGVSRVSWA